MTGTLSLQLGGEDVLDLLSKHDPAGTEPYLVSDSDDEVDESVDALLSRHYPEDTEAHLVSDNEDDEFVE